MIDTTRRYPRTVQDAFKGPDYANAIEAPERGMLASGWFWTGGAVSLALWSLLCWVWTR